MTGERVHLIGIGGAGMSAIAGVLMEMGVAVSGSDLKESRNTRRLQERGATIFIGHRPENVEGATTVIYSSAIRPGNKELMRARELGLDIVPRAEMLGRLMDRRKGIAVAGTHGKTTTTSMISKILCEAGYDPTFIVGGELNDIGSNARYGEGEYLVAEADESDGSFLLLQPFACVITNVEEEHHDFYRNWEQVKSYYRSFMERVKPQGVMVLNGDDPTLVEISAQLKTEKIFFGEGRGHTYGFDQAHLEPGGSRFTIYFNGERMGEVELRVPGMHNIRNATASIAITHRLGARFGEIRKALGDFKGVSRRFELVGTEKGVLVVDDYAHHPTEIRATLEVAKNHEYDRVVCIFQPHRYSRTAALWRELGKCLGLADLVIITEVYAAGENPLPGVNSKLIVDALLEEYPRKEVVYIPKRSQLGKASLKYIRQGDLVLTMGAGDVTQCSLEILEGLRNGDGAAQRSLDG